MAGRQIANYSAGFSFNIDNASVTRILKQIANIKKNFEKNLGKLEIKVFSINTDSLNRALKNANVVLPINRFLVNSTELQRQVQNSLRTVNLNVNANTRVRSGGGGSGGRDRVSNILDRGTGFIPAAASYLGIKGLNETSQEIAANRLSLNSNTGGRGEEAYEWMRRTANEIGFSYHETMPVFSNYLASSVNKQGFENSLQSFKDLQSYGFTHGATKVSSQRAMMSLGQMWSKGKIMAEELNQQLAEATGFGSMKQLIAKAYQESKGGKLVGQEAEADLLDNMKKGNVITAKVMPIATRMAGEESKAMIGKYQNSTQAAQGRYNNSYIDTVERFGKAGFDEGMKRFFNNLASLMENNQKAVDQLGKSFHILIDIMEGVVNTGQNVYNFFNDLSESITTAVLILAPLWKVLGKTAMMFLGLALAMDDVDAYINGKDSVLGGFLDYMQELTGMDWNGIAIGVGVVGAAILTAFAPLTAAVMGVGVLVEAYRYLQRQKAEKIAKNTPILPSTVTLPEWEDSATNRMLQFDKKGADKKLPWYERLQAKSWSMFTNVAPDISNGIAGASFVFGSSPLKARALDLVGKGVITPEQYERLTVAAGSIRGVDSGYRGAEVWLDQQEKRWATLGSRNYQGNTQSVMFPNSNITVQANDPIQFVNQMSDMIRDKTLPNFSNIPQPKPTEPTK